MLVASKLALLFTRTLYRAEYVLALGYRIHTHKTDPVCYMENTEQESTHPKYWSTSRVRLGKYNWYLCTKYGYYALASTCKVQYSYYLRTVMFRQEKYLKNTTGSTLRHDTYLPRRSVVPVVYGIRLEYQSATKTRYNYEWRP